jgi:tetratricopeptide (TPR) repeat protein
MRRNTNKPVFALLIVGAIGIHAGDTVFSEAAAPPVPRRSLDHEQQTRLSQLEGQLQQALESAKFADALEKARQIAQLRERWLGKDHWESVAARQTMPRIEAMMRLPEQDQRDLATSYRAERAGRVLNGRHEYQKAEAIHRRELRIRRRVLGEEHPDTASSYNNVAFTLVAQGKYAEAQPLCEKSLAIYRRTLGDRHTDTSRGYNNVAANLNRQGKYAEAQPLYQKALAIWRDLEGEFHVDTAQCYVNVAGNLHAQGKHALAMPVWEKSLAICRKVLGEEHRVTSSSYHGMGLTAYATGNYARAGSAFDKALAIRLKVFGENHPDTAQAYLAVAHNLHVQGKHAQAQPHFERALAIHRKILGEKHPETAQAYDALALNLKAQAKYAEAQPLCERALAICREVLGDEHPYTAVSYGHLADILNALARYTQAQRMYEKALAIRRKVLGEEHHDTAASYSNLATNLNDQGKYAQAQPLCEKALAICLKRSGKRHPSTASAYNNLAFNLHFQDRYVQAQPLFEHAAAIYQEVYGEEHPTTSTSYGNLAGSLRAQGKYAQAQAYLERSLAIDRRVLGEDHPQTAGTYLELAANLFDQGKYAEAQPLFEKSLAIRRNVLGEEHPLTAYGYMQLAYNLEAQHQFARAQPLFEKALQLRRKVLGDEHVQTADSYNAVAFNLDDQGKLEQAQPLYEKALAIRLKVLGEERPDTAQSFNNVAANLRAQGKYDEALLFYEKALAINRRVLGDEHPNTALSYNNLALNLWKQKQFARAVRVLQISLPGQEASRYQRAASGFERAVAGRQVSPHALLAVGLAHLKQPRNAFRHAEASLSRGLLDDLPADITPEEAARAKALRTQLAGLDRALLSQFGEAVPSDARKERREELFRQRRQLLSQLTRGEAEVSARALSSLTEIQKQLPADAALVLWIGNQAGDHYACAVRAAGDPAWVRLPGSGSEGAWTDRDRLLTRQLYDLLQEPNSSQKERQHLSAALTRLRLDPLRPYLGAGNGLPVVQRLLVVPTDWAAGVPLEVLGTGYRISYVPSGSVFARLRQQHRAVDGASLLALGDPVFTMPTQRRPEPPEHGVVLTFVMAGGTAKSTGLRAGDVLLELGKTPITSPDDLKKTSQDGGTLRFWREGEEKTVELPAGPIGVRVDPRPAPAAVRARRRLESLVVAGQANPVALPGTRWEVQALSNLVQKTTALLGSDASEQRLDEMAKAKQLKSYRLIHLATHGLVDLQTPGRSTLLLSRDRSSNPLKLAVGQKHYTGELTVLAIRQNWQLDADLVVLSACKTALGKESQGDGLLGFAQAFLQCGARSVVLSRWEADDTATALLMLRFYENLLAPKTRTDLKGPLPRAAALDEARQWLRQLSKRDAEMLAFGLRGGKLEGTTRRGSIAMPDVKVRPKLPAGERPYAHPFYWAAFVLVGDPD